MSYVDGFVAAVPTANWERCQKHAEAAAFDRPMNPVDTSSHVTVRVTQRFNASADHVFDAWLDTTMGGKWLFATASRPMSRVSIDARVGGSFRLVEGPNADDVVNVGKFFEIIRPNRLVFTLSSASSRWQATGVSVNIVPLTTGCELTLVHERVLWSDANLTEGRWSGMLYGLSMLLDRPARTTRRDRKSHINDKEFENAVHGHGQSHPEQRSRRHAE